MPYPDRMTPRIRAALASALAALLSVVTLAIPVQAQASGGWVRYEASSLAWACDSGAVCLYQFSGGTGVRWQRLHATIYQHSDGAGIRCMDLNADHPADDGSTFANRATSYYHRGTTAGTNDYITFFDGWGCTGKGTTVPRPGIWGDFSAYMNDQTNSVYAP